MANGEPWWGTVQLRPMEMRAIDIGPLEIWLQRRPREWRVSYRYGAEPQMDGVREPLSDEPPSDTERLRIADPGTLNEIDFTCRLADRPVVARPETRLVVPGKSETDFFVGSPAWLSMSVSDDSDPTLELPVRPTKASWMGTSTQVGELCYALRTHARLLEEELKRTPGHGRPVTRVTLTNKARDPLAVERISLPVPNLAIYVDSDGDLWTADVLMDRSQNGATISVRTAGGPPQARPEAKLLTEARIPQPNPVVRALGVLFS